MRTITETQNANENKTSSDNIVVVVAERSVFQVHVPGEPRKVEVRDYDWPREADTDDLSSDYELVEDGDERYVRSFVLTQPDPLNKPTPIVLRWTEDHPESDDWVVMEMDWDADDLRRFEAGEVELIKCSPHTIEDGELDDGVADISWFVTVENYERSSVMALFVAEMMKIAAEEYGEPVVLVGHSDEDGLGIEKHAPPIDDELKADHPWEA